MLPFLLFYEKTNDKNNRQLLEQTKTKRHLIFHKRLIKMNESEFPGLFEGTDRMMSGVWRTALIISWRVVLMRHLTRALLLQFLCPRRDHGIMSRILVRHRITHDDPTTWPFPYPSEAIAPDSEISIFVIIIVKEADALILLINFATATRPDSMIKALQEASSTMLSISSAAITFHSNCFWELLATRIPSILSLISWGTLKHGSKFLFFKML